jgi:SNF2 family DNA or RNA helicase
VLNPAIVDAFLARQLDNFDWMKQQTVEELDKALDELKPKPQYAGFWAHQKVCFLLIETLKRFMLHLDMGAGKTLVALAILRHRKQRGEKPKAIVFVPYITAVETWVEECAKHTPELFCIPLLGSTEENLQALATVKADLFVICYQSAVAMLAEPVKTKGKGKKKWAINPSVSRETFATFDMLIMDEIHRAKSIQSLTYRMLRAISAHCEYAIGLTGTPFGRDLQDLWPQFYLIDFGETLGETFGIYREAFFNKKAGFWGGFDYKFKKRLFPKLQATIKNCSIRYNVDEFADMPARKYVPIKLEAHQGIKAYAEQAIAKITDIVRGKGQYRELESEYIKLRQLSSGFMTLKGEDNDKLQIAFDENPKLDALQGLVESMPPDCKMIVFHHFIYTNQIISDRLKAMKVPHTRVYGKTRDPISELRKFKTDPKCRVLVLNSKSGSSSLNLQIANYICFFENPDSAIDRQQAERRVWRPGQEKRVWIYDLIMKDTWDEKIRKANAEGRNLLAALLDGKELLT